jgi:hypothetical protein
VKSEEKAESPPQEAPVAVEAAPPLQQIAQLSDLVRALTAIDARLKAVEEAISTHSHGASPELVQYVASAAKEQTLAHLQERLGMHIARLLLK